MKPILFSTAMVQAILAGNKTQTRRVVKCYATSEAHPTRQTAEWQFENKTCPYGNVGDTLWVRETYTQNGLNYFRYKADWGSNKYPTGEPEGTFINKSVPVNFRGKWKPSIHMPFAACRIFLKIKSIRVERLQSITDADILKEGVRIPVSDKSTTNNTVVLELTGKDRAISFLPDGRCAQGQPKLTQHELLFIHWAQLWCEVNGRENWNLNPWVWVIEFERTEKPSTQTKPQPQLVYCKNCGKERVGEVHCPNCSSTDFEPVIIM